MEQEPNQKISYKNFQYVSYIKLILILLLSYSNTITLHSQTLSAEQIYEKVKDAVVVILAYDYSDELAAQGSGVVLNDKGYVVTNYHVLSGCERLEIRHGEEIVPYVDIIGIDVEKDILILKIEEKKFPSIKIGDVKALKVGQRVYAIGSPMGFENTISEGIISGLRSYEELNKNYIQITASISPGSSGGAVVNDKGELIGISTLTVKDGQNLNFAIPINEVLRLEIGSYSKDNAFKDFELFEKGLVATDKGNYNEAVKYYSQFIIIYPYSTEAYNNRGTAKSNLNDYTGAIQDYNKAIEINQYYSIAYYNRGIAKSDLGDLTGAIQDFNKAIEIDPNYVNAFINRGISKGKLENYRSAIQDFNKAIEINPYDADIYYNRGFTKYLLEDYRGAIQDYSKAIEIDPNYVNAYINRGIAKSNLDDYTGAIQDYNKTIKIDPYYAEAYYNSGIAKRELEDYGGAIQDYNKAIEINPNFAAAHFNRGSVKYILGDKSGACLDWSKAGELGDYDAYDSIRKYCN